VRSSLLTHSLPDDDELWLKYAGNADNFDPRLARVALYEQLPPNFDPRRIDRRFYESDNLTLIGLRRFKPNAPILGNIEKLALTIRKKLLAKPGIESIQVKQLCEEAGVSQFDGQMAIKALQELSSFFTGLSHSRDSDFVEQVWFSGPSGYDGPLKFTTLDAALEELFRMQSFLPGLTSGNWTQNDKDTAKKVPPPREQESVKKGSAFVIMPIDPNIPELEDVLDAIKSVAAAFGIAAYRADEIEHQGVITNVVLAEIRECEYLIADLSLERPNVYYEIGYAHALDKKPILYRRKGTRLHFDLSVHNVPEYANVKELKELLRKRFEAILGRTAT